MQRLIWWTRFVSMPKELSQATCLHQKVAQFSYTELLIHSYDGIYGFIGRLVALDAANFLPAMIHANFRDFCGRNKSSEQSVIAMLRERDTEEVKLLSEDDFSSFLMSHEKENAFCVQSFLASKGKNSYRTYGYASNSTFQDVNLFAVQLQFGFESGPAHAF